MTVENFYRMINPKHMIGKILMNELISNSLCIVLYLLVNHQVQKFPVKYLHYAVY